MSFRVQFWGTRGSIPSPGRSTVRYGGNTPCVEVRTTDGWLVILDAGTGIRELGRTLIERANGAPIHGDIFLTHAHWDHIQGIPFFAPIFQRGNHFTIWGSKTLETSIDRVVRDQMSPVVFPVAFEELDATIDFRSIAEGERSAGTGYEVTAMEVRHPGGALAYRFVEPRTKPAALVYVSDNELGHSERYTTPTGWRERFVAFVRDASVLVHDTTYTTEEYDHHRGWGHSTYRDGVELALQAGVGTLVLFHHEPRRTDEEVDRRLDECRALVKERGGTLEVVAAAEGLSLTV
ncbi:MAG TPA: MBL fold metallo-hydrolase [Gemmatimonadaceae bacterium]|nr:MBL fold metallo-hydrolase [Gemmatimonadaceae bacterium]